MWKWEADGQPKGVAIIIHNAYEHHRRYAWLIEKLRTSQFHVITGDLPGHGEVQSNKEAHDEDFRDYQAYIKKMIEQALTYNLPIFIIGHGLGATFAIHMVEKYKYEVAGLILSSPWFHLVNQPSKVSSALTGISKIAGSIKITHDMPIKSLTKSFSFFEEEKDDPRYNTRVTVRWYRELQNFTKAIYNLENEMLDIPVLMMIGEKDKITDTKYAHKWINNQKLSEYQFKTWQNAYHDLFLEPEREDIYYYVEDFMANRLRSIGYIVEE